MILDSSNFLWSSTVFVTESELTEYKKVHRPTKVDSHILYQTLSFSQNFGFTVYTNYCQGALLSDERRPIK